MCSCGEHHTNDGNYYVSVVNATRVFLLLGPYLHHEDALAKLPHAKAKAEAVDLWAHFYAFGTVSLPAAYLTPGLFNETIGRW